MIKIYPYKMGSASVSKLKQQLNAKIIKLENSAYRYRVGDIILNWGNSTLPSWINDSVREFVLNQPEAVRAASNKLMTLVTFETEGVPTVPWTTSPDQVATWLEEGSKVFVRHSLNGHSGEGIEVLTPNTSMQFTDSQQELIEFLESVSLEVNEMGFSPQAEIVQSAIETVLPLVITGTNNIPPAPLYTKGVNNAGEYRVHVFNGDVILYQKKSRRVDEDGNVVTADGEQADIRNLASNWVYRTGNLRRLERVEQLAVQAIVALQLDFGAVDILMDNNGDVFVLEVNTAPGLGNEETITAYVNALT